jgi:hypothetical protein
MGQKKPRADCEDRRGATYPRRQRTKAKTSYEPRDIISMWNATSKPMKTGGPSAREYRFSKCDDENDSESGRATGTQYRLSITSLVASGDDYTLSELR